MVDKPVTSKNMNNSTLGGTAARRPRSQSLRPPNREQNKKLK